MTFLDTYLQHQRIKEAARQIAHGAHVLDIGCFNGELFTHLHNVQKKTTGIGVDPLATAKQLFADVKIIPGLFPQDITSDDKFTCITALAVFEHIPEHEQQSFLIACFKRLEPGGLLIMTIPHPLVDYLLKILQFLRLVKGMSTEQHYGFDVNQTTAIAKKAGFQLHKHHRFQLGLNNLFVFKRPAAL